MADDDKTIHLSPEEYDRWVDSVSEVAKSVATEVTTSAVFKGIARFLEQYADMVERAPVRGADAAEQRGSEAALRAVAADMRKVVQTIRQEHGSGPDFIDVSVRKADA